MTTTVPDAPEDVPHVKPRLRFRRSEAVGMLIVALLPFLAVLGMFGPHQARVAASAGPVNLEVRYPSHVRHGMHDRIEITVANRSSEVIPLVEVSLDRRYLDGFSDVSFVPSADSAFVVRLRDLRPGEDRRVRVALEADAYGWRRGGVRVTSDGASADAELSTFVFP